MISKSGYFLVWRELFEKPIWLNSSLEQQSILMVLLAMANWKENQWEWEGKQFTVKAGQFITSLESIKKATGNKVSLQNVRTALKRFEKLNFLTYQSTKTGRLVTIVNWQDYQVVDGVLNIAPNKDLTKTSHRPNIDLTTIEEGNKVNKVKKEIKDISLQIKDLRSRFEDAELKIIDEYFDILRWTRKHGNIADSVTLKIYQEWEKYPISKVVHALNIYITNPKYHDKKENYCYGIMRNATAEEVESIKDMPKKKDEQTTGQKSNYEGSGY